MWTIADYDTNDIERTKQIKRIKRIKRTKRTKRAKLMKLIKQIKQIKQTKRIELIKWIEMIRYNERLISQIFLKIFGSKMEMLGGGEKGHLTTIWLPGWMA